VPAVPSRRLAPVSLLAGLLALAACGPGGAPPEPETPAVAPESLLAHSAEFERRVYAVGEGVHVAVGFALANSILVEGEACDFVVDTTESVESARAVRAAFAEISSRPIEALVYTHNHADHVFGGPGFAPEGGVEVYAHETTESYIDRVVGVIRPIVGARSARMFGTHLPETGPDRMVNAGIGPALELGHGGGTPGLLRPTRVFDDRLEMEICGVRVVMEHAPGETNDQIFLWLPERRTLLPGDNVYRAFPNLYTIRGTLYRDVLAWVASLDRMRDLRPAHLVPSHTRPVSGEAEIAEILTAYRDAIQLVHDQTLRGMNQGLTPDELVHFVKLPPHLAEHPWLREHYGTVEWSVRSVFTGYLGWFDGEAAHLSPAPPDERARGLAELAGGREALVAAAESALGDGRVRWAAELAHEALRLDPEDGRTREVLASSLRILGHRSVSPNGRNTYLTRALELEGRAEVGGEVEIDERVRPVAQGVPIGNFLRSMPVFLDPERAADTDIKVGFRFPDAGESYTIHVRRGVAALREGFPEDFDVAITTDASVWRDVVLGFRNAPLAFASDDVDIDGSAVDLVRFLRLFDR